VVIGRNSTVSDHTNALHHTFIHSSQLNAGNPDSPGKMAIKTDCVQCATHLHFAYECTSFMLVIWSTSAVFQKISHFNVVVPKALIASFYIAVV